jgi:hypothetical protein
MDVRTAIYSTFGEIGVKIQQKREKVIKKNLGFMKIRQIGQVLSGENLQNYSHR